MTTETTKVNEATRFDFMGEFVDLPPAIGYQLKARMEQAAKNLHVAKTEAFAVENEIKEVMQGFENLRVDGEIIATWKWVDGEDFDKKAFKNLYPDVFAQFVKKVKNKTRRFNFKTVVGVD